MGYACTIGCKTCNYAPKDVTFYEKADVLAVIFHEQLLEDDHDREIRIRLDDHDNEMASFVAEHQKHHLVYIDRDGIHEPNIDDLPLTKVTYSHNRQN